MKPSLHPDAFPVGFVSDFRGYTKPSRQDIAVLVCHFSPAGFRKPLENAKRVVADMRQAGIPIYSAEMSYEGHKRGLVDPDLSVKCSSFMFHKENLLNLLLGVVPDKFSKVVFLDSDIRFNYRDWLDKVSHSLDSCDLMQPMEWCFWSSSANKISAAEQLRRGRKLDMGHTHPGFATAARRDWLDRVGGLYDLAVVGNGDACLWHAAASKNGLGFESKSMKEYSARYEGLADYVNKVSANTPRIGSIRGCFAGHMPHGTADRRSYQKRHSILQGDISVRKNESGAYEWNDPSNNAKMLDYFKSRNEDNLTDKDTLDPHMDEQTLEIFRELLKNAKSYIEYGCGGSTVFAFTQSNTKIICVDTDPSWLEMVLNFIPGDLSRLDACHVGLGEVTDWGYPTDTNADGTVYASWPWTRTKDCDLVLIDGRFRVACFAKTMLEAKPGTAVLFEDYFDRNNYKEVEKIASPKSKHGRTALFIRPGSIDTNLASLLLRRHAKDPS